MINSSFQQHHHRPFNLPQGLFQFQFGRRKTSATTEQHTLYGNTKMYKITQSNPEGQNFNVLSAIVMQLAEVDC